MYFLWHYVYKRNPEKPFRVKWNNIYNTETATVGAGKVVLVEYLQSIGEALGWVPNTS